MVSDQSMCIFINTKDNIAYNTNLYANFYLE